MQQSFAINKQKSNAVPIFLREFTKQFYFRNRNILQLLSDCEYCAHKNTFDTDLLAKQCEYLAGTCQGKLYIFLCARKSLGNEKSTLPKQFVILVRNVKLFPLATE